MNEMKTSVNYGFNQIIKLNLSCFKFLSVVSILVVIGYY